MVVAKYMMLCLPFVCRLCGNLRRMSIKTTDFLSRIWAHDPWNTKLELFATPHAGDVITSDTCQSWRQSALSDTQEAASVFSPETKQPWISIGLILNPFQRSRTVRNEVLLAAEAVLSLGVQVTIPEEWTNEWTNSILCLFSWCERMLS
jgi:hypothetical protein